MSRVLDVLAEYRARALARDRAVARELTRRWLRVEDALEAEIEALAQELGVLKAAGKAASASQLWSMERLRSLLAQAQTQQQAFAQFASGLISREQYLSLHEGIAYGVDSIRAVMASAGVVSSFSLLPVEAVNIMVGFSADGTPLSQLLTASYPETVTQITDALVRSMALGTNPRQTAVRIREAMAGNLQRAMVVARTEELRAERVASVQQYQASGVVTGYRRHAAFQDRTCLACLLLDGTLYPVMEQFSDHPNGRCFCIPEIAGIESPAGQTGEEWFTSQKADTQRAIMGDGHYQAWQRGDFELRDAARMHNDPTWGEAPQVVPLKELVEQAA
jgi:hypothetical protein